MACAFHASACDAVPSLSGDEQAGLLSLSLTPSSSSTGQVTIFPHHHPHFVSVPQLHLPQHLSSSDNPLASYGYAHASCGRPFTTTSKSAKEHCLILDTDSGAYCSHQQCCQRFATDLPGRQTTSCPDLTQSGFLFRAPRRKRQLVSGSHFSHISQPTVHFILLILQLSHVVGCSQKSFGAGAANLAATCEDWDEDEDDNSPDTRTSANVAVKRAQPELKAKASYERRRNDGSDSGYSSRTGTIDSDLSGPRKMTGLTSKTGIAERERQPYSLSQSRPEVHRQSSSRPQDPGDDRQSSKSKKYKHAKGICDLCDYYGWHAATPADPPQSASRSSVPASPQKSQRPVPTATADDHGKPPVMRRTSSTRGQRPMSMYANMPTQYQYANVPVQTPVYAQPLSTPLGWSTTPMSPAAPYTPTYSYASVPVVAPQGVYVEHRPAYEYFDQSTKSIPVIHPPNPKRRSTTYDKPVIKHVAETITRPIEKASNQDMQPSQRSQRSSQDRENIIMGPPPRPEPRPAEVIVPRRPSLNKATTYTPTTSTHGRSVTLEAEQLPPLPPTPTSRERRTSPSRPPTSYRGPQSSDPERPNVPKKAQSYSTTTHTTKIASSDRPSQSTTAGLPRRTTMPGSLPRERHEDEAEAYQRDARGLTSNDWMEAVRKTVVPNRDISERSETGSSKSYKSHRSGSRASSGGGSTRPQIVLRLGDATITTNAPVTVDRAGNIKIETKSGAGMTFDGTGQKRIERAPSVTSRTSRVSAHSGIVISNGGGKAGDRDNLGTSRRSSRPTELYPEDVRAQLRDSFTVRGREDSSTEDLDHERNGSRRMSQSHTRSHSRPASILGRNSINQGQRRGSERDDRGVSDFY